MCRKAFLSEFFLEPPTMRTLKLHFPDDALPTFDAFLKQTKEARVFRRAQAVRDGVVVISSNSTGAHARC
jgi:hypothetical protein